MKNLVLFALLLCSALTHADEQCLVNQESIQICKGMSVHFLRKNKNWEGEITKIFNDGTIQIGYEVTEFYYTFDSNINSTFFSPQVDCYKELCSGSNSKVFMNTRRGLISGKVLKAFANGEILIGYGLDGFYWTGFWNYSEIKIPVK